MSEREQEKKFKYIYGPVYSWRLGYSLGVDPLSCEKKICNFNCRYCQLGELVELINTRDTYVSTQEILQEIEEFPEMEIVDYVTFSGRGEPTLAKNLGEMIKAIKQGTDKKVAVITNSVLLHCQDVIDDLLMADLVLAKLDASDQEMLNAVNRPAKAIDMEDIVEGIIDFKKQFKGKLAIQIMFVDGNKHKAQEIAEIVKRVDADEIQLNTPLRPSQEKPLSQDQMLSIKGYFAGLPATTVYENQAKQFTPVNDDDTTKRHGDYKA